MIRVFSESFDGLPANLESPHSLVPNVSTRKNIRLLGFPSRGEL